MILDIKDWKEFHDNGTIHIEGKIGIVAEMWKHIYDYRLSFKGYEGKAVVRIGVWTNYYDNGQLWWKLDFGDGTHEFKGKEKFPSYRKDGSHIVQ